MFFNSLTIRVAQKTLQTCTYVRHYFCSRSGVYCYRNICQTHNKFSLCPLKSIKRHRHQGSYSIHALPSLSNIRKKLGNRQEIHRPFPVGHAFRIKRKDIHKYLKTDTCNRSNCHICVLTALLMRISRYLPSLLTRNET